MPATDLDGNARVFDGNVDGVPLGQRLLVERNGQRRADEFAGTDKAGAR